MKDTFYVAKQAGDAKFLRWLHDRLEFVHGENPDVDYMHRLRDFVAWFEGDPLKGAEGKLKAAIEAANLASSWIALADARLERAEIAEAERDAAVAALATAKEAMKLADDVMEYCQGDAWERECTADAREAFARKYIIIFPPDPPPEPKLTSKQRKAKARAALASNSGGKEGES